MMINDLIQWVERKESFEPAAAAARTKTNSLTNTQTDRQTDRQDSQLPKKTKQWYDNNNMVVFNRFIVYQHHRLLLLLGSHCWLKTIHVNGAIAFSSKKMSTKFVLVCAYLRSSQNCFTLHDAINRSYFNMRTVSNLFHLRMVWNSDHWGQGRILFAWYVIPLDCSTVLCEKELKKVRHIQFACDIFFSLYVHVTLCMLVELHHDFLTKIVIIAKHSKRKRVCNFKENSHLKVWTRFSSLSLSLSLSLIWTS